MIEEIIDEFNKERQSTDEQQSDDIEESNDGDDVEPELVQHFDNFCKIPKHQHVEEQTRHNPIMRGVRCPVLRIYTITRDDLMSSI